MGNYFKTIPKEPFDESLVTFLKTRKLQHINEVINPFNQTIEIVNDCYPTHSTFTLEEFLDAFGGTLEDWCEQVFILLENNHSVAGIVDIYESLAVLIVFSGEEFQTKLEFVFKMFDFDHSGEIEKKELIMILQTNIRALCKIAKLKTPEIKDLEFFAQKMFIKLDADRSDSISFNEFSEWLLYNWELQDFMLQYVMLQTYENADRRTKERLILYQELFEASAGDKYKETCEIESISIIFHKELSKQKEETIKLLMTIIQNSSNNYNKADKLQEGLILKEAYLDVMQAWAAFDATDINQDNQTSISELKYLLYAYEGDKPDLFRIQHEMEILDKDGSGLVSREEWISYLCIGEKTKSVFRGNLKLLFNKYDADNSGALSLREIRSLLTDNMRDLYLKFRNKGKQEQENFEGMIVTLANQIIDTLNSTEDQQNDERTLTWIEFKNFMEEAYSKQEELRAFMQQFV